MTFAWSDRYATGHTLVDHQHRSLFEAIAAFEAALAAGEAGPRVEETLAFLERYAREHFATEEFLMIQEGYPDRPPHKLEHDRLLLRVRYIQDLRAQDPALVPAEGLGAFLGQWLQQHILEWDLRLFDHLRARGRT